MDTVSYTHARQNLASLLDKVGQGGAPVIITRQGHPPAVLGPAAAVPQPVGPFRDEAAALDVLTARLVHALDPLEVWLFGSRARGEARPDSDFDLITVLPDDSPFVGDYAATRAPVDGLGVPVDVVPYALGDFLEDQADPGSPAAAARCLYQRSTLG